MIKYKLLTLFNHYWLFFLGFAYVIGITYLDLTLAGEFLTKGESYMLATIMALAGLLLGKLEDILVEVKRPEKKDKEV